MKKINIAFSTKLLIALVGLVGFLLLFSFFVVRYETTRQIDWAVEQAAKKSQKAFKDVEELWRGELEKLSRRFSGSNRMPSALEAAMEDHDPEVLIGAANYELKLAGISNVLTVFSDTEGNPVISLLNGKAWKWLSKIPDAGESATNKNGSFGYYLFQDLLFAVEIIPLQLGRPIGRVMLGFPVDEGVGKRLGEVIGAEVCFVVNHKIIFATPAAAKSELLDKMVSVAGGTGFRTMVLQEKRWAMFSEELTPLHPEEGYRVVAIPLEEVLAPFERIEKTLSFVGLSGLLLAFFIGVILSRGLSAPIRSLVVATERVAKGDLDFEVQVRSHDEIGALGRAFNNMVNGLTLKEKYRSLLDKVVSHDVAEEMLKGEIFLGGENRKVSTLFADIRGFTSMTEGMPPQEVIAMLNEYMDFAASAVDEEGGVVDKYVGDEIMAIFGAPIGHDDDALRAVKAAIRMRDSMGKLNENRQRRNKPPISIGIGINSGAVVAGNMGSKNRLNYTVLGESVNVAARLCSKASPNEIIIPEFTYNAVKDSVKAIPLEPATLKGISKPVNVYAVQGLKDPQGKSSHSIVSNNMLFILLICSFFLLLPGEAHAEEEYLDTPTLSELGIGYVSPSGFFEVGFSGRLDLEGYFPQKEPPWLVKETKNFMTGKGKLFIDAFLGDNLYSFTELRVDRGEVPAAEDIEGRIEQTFMRLSHSTTWNIHFQVGKFASPFGGYPQRYDTTADPFIRPPLSYDYRTVICPILAPPTNDGFIGWKNSPERFRIIGAPVIWRVPYQIGGMFFGDFRDISFRIAVMNGAPSSGPDEWNSMPTKYYGPSYVAHIGYRLSPELRLGVSYNVGPYSQPKINSTLPDGKNISDFVQEIWGFEATYTRGRTEIKAELFHDRWEVPNVQEDPVDISYYSEIKHKLMAGFYGALRYNAIHFNKIAKSNGVREQWDYDVKRWQIASGYSFNKKMEIRMEYMWNMTDASADPEDNLFSIQWIRSF